MKQEPGTGTAITPSSVASTSTLQRVQVPSPVLQSAVHVHKPVAGVPQPIKMMHTRTLNRPTAVHPAPVQRVVAAKPISPSKVNKKKKVPVSMATAQSATATSLGENTGRWTAEEHRLFLQGLEQHGKGWKKIASLIKSRTVVQIRTHAQKYFQKIAKARQNGEEGEVSMENRERVVISNSTKRRRGGTKRKAIASVVASAEREGKKIRTEKSKNVAPALTPYVYPLGAPLSLNTEIADGLVTPTEPAPGGHGTVPSITTALGTISGAALEDSLFRFLTPMPNETTQGPSGQVNDVARQAGANPITVPSGSKNTHPQFGGEISPNCIIDFPSNWAWTSEPPSWYGKGADVDELLNEADALDWLADSGDLHETYMPSPDHSVEMSEPSLLTLVEPEEIMSKQPDMAPPLPVLETSTMTTSDSATNMPQLPSLFESGIDLSEMKREKSMNLSSASLFASATEAADAEHDEENFHLLDAQFDEQAFVTALLDQNSVSVCNLNQLDQ